MLKSQRANGPVAPAVAPPLASWPARFAALLLLAAVLFHASAPRAQDAGARIYIEAGRLLADPAAGEVLTDQTLVVQDGLVVEIRNGFVAPPGAHVIDLRHSFVLPGLIDSHVHLLGGEGGGASFRDGRTSAQMAFFGAANARKTLRAGFTTVADVGGDSEAIFALRDAIAQGQVEGPRILASGSVVTPHGGDSDVHGRSAEYIELYRPATVCSGVEGCRRAVREQINLGADLIKITATGGVLADTDTGVGQQFLPDELQAIVEAAHALGRRVTAHAHGTDGINAALRAGVDSIEHGTFLDDDSIRMFRKQGAYLVPTLLAGDTVTRMSKDPNWRSPAVRRKAQAVGPRMIEAARRAHAAGVNMAFGTDTGVSPHGQNAREFALMVQAGFSPRQAIAAATVWAADHLQLSRTIGALAPGKAADIIAVEGDPLSDVTLLEHVSFVMKAGRPVPLGPAS